MAEVSELASIVGEAHLLTGDAIVDDYTHDEALTAEARPPLAVVRAMATLSSKANVSWPMPPSTVTSSITLAWLMRST